ncbi:YCII-related protein [Arcobacter nitrofigilis DSM 7299]|uniref:YCII-related protein n=1 Tax=Arcobacter nitrofigilis (strain ATCC 33309 / DSM 7299 / CCUG 15893 / LMG 7604 / NCTC 12251 / CI) TaxID=572480 RepID=D5V6J2_ARCNC|nr:YciI family protein [Arcobacter nitrofigilis]ADG94262.1 YCII-related protein [Arcobacter nitrofigilis DSM 7299]
MQYLIIAYDNDNALDKRLEVRDAHVAGAKKLIAEGKIINAGALIEEDQMVGSTLFVDFESEDELNDWIDNEPYVVNKVWNMDEFQIVPVKLLPKS